MTEIKLFNEWLETSEMSTSGIALWYALMYIANRSGWRPELCIPISAIILRTNLSRSAIYKERAVLRYHGLIEFETGDGRHSGTYRICSFESRLVSTVVSATNTQPETQLEEVPTLASTTRTQNEEPSTLVSTPRTQPETQDEFVSPTEAQSGSIYKPKQDLSSDKKDKFSLGKKKKDMAQKSDFDLSFVGVPIWEELLRTWLEYKRGRNQSYKSELSVKKFLSMLRNLSRDDPKTAQQIIDKSIANNWAGIFELNQADSRPRGQPPDRPATGQRIGQIKQPEDDARRQQLLDRFGKKQQ